PGQEDLRRGAVERDAHGRRVLHRPLGVAPRLEPRADRPGRLADPALDDVEDVPAVIGEDAAARDRGVEPPVAVLVAARRRRPRTWPWTATLPKPMIAPRSILPEPVLPDDGSQGLVQDREPRQRLLFADHERRVDPDRGRVRHGDEAAAQTLLVERLRDGLRDRRLRGPIGDELDPEHQALASHLAP